ncbi:MAG: NADH-quinone oxidoreductase subunit NuoN [Alphaproteobacteria bacterium]|nr:NADH-quinone oxidoreductase subunit NuoN [Alphaproteobacteria bacterium]
MGIFETLSFAAPELVLVLGAMALLITGVFIGDKSAKQIGYACVGLLLVAVLLVLFSPTAPTASLFDGAFRIDAFSTFSKVIIYLAAAVAILMSDQYFAGEKLRRFEYPVLIVLAVFGMSLMVSATDLISLYMGIETQSLALYILAAFKRDSRRSTEAGLKYFVLGALSTCLLLYGASLIYGFTGSTSFEEIARIASMEGANVGLIFGLVFLISGLAFKVSAAPFHMWTPDVYEGAPTPVAAFFSAAPKLAGMALFARVLVSSFHGALGDWQPVLAMIAVASMAVGAFSAIPQSNIKRLMAYSSIGHMGYALIGLSAGTAQGVKSVLIYMTIYVAMTIGAFACILMMRRRGGMTENIADLSGLTKTNMPLAIILTVLLFSLAGVPPTAGFFGKWYVFLAAVEAKLVWLAIVGVFASAVSAYYYLRIVWFMWFDEAAEPFERDAGPALKLTAWGSALLMFPVLTIFMGRLTELAGRAAAALF